MSDKTLNEQTRAAATQFMAGVGGRTVPERCEGCGATGVYLSECGECGAVICPDCDTEGLCGVCFSA